MIEAERAAQARREAQEARRAAEARQEATERARAAQEAEKARQEAQRAVEAQKAPTEPEMDPAVAYYERTEGRLDRLDKTAPRDYLATAAHLANAGSRRFGEFFRAMAGIGDSQKVPEKTLLNVIDRGRAQLTGLLRHLGGRIEASAGSVKWVRGRPRPETPMGKALAVKDRLPALTGRYCVIEEFHPADSQSPDNHAVVLGLFEDGKRLGYMAATATNDDLGGWSVSLAPVRDAHMQTVLSPTPEIARTGSQIGSQHGTRVIWDPEDGKPWASASGKPEVAPPLVMDFDPDKRRVTLKVSPMPEERHLPHRIEDEYSLTAVETFTGPASAFWVNGHNHAPHAAESMALAEAMTRENRPKPGHRPAPAPSRGPSGPGM